MPAFTFHAVDARGVRQRGSRDGATLESVVRSLEDQGMLVLSCNESPERATRAVLLFRRRAVLGFARALASLVEAGLPLARAIRSAEYVTPPALKPVLRDLGARVDRGDAFAAALQAHPRLFRPVFVGTVRSGERSGDLAGALNRVAAHLEREDEFQSRLLSVATYPLLLSITGVVALGVLFVVVLPRFIDLQTGVGATLPLSTTVLLVVANAGRKFAPYAPACLLGAVILFGIMQSSGAGRSAMSRLLLRSPVMGPLRRRVLATRFARAMSVLLGGGTPLLVALEQAAASIADPVARNEIERVHGRVRAGTPLHIALSERSFFPPLLIQLIGIGEKASRLEEFFAKSADLFERDTQRTMERFATTAEPLLVIVFGIIIGLVALALFQAIYGVNAGIIQ